MKSVEHVGIIGAGSCRTCHGEDTPGCRAPLHNLRTRRRLGGVWADGYSNFGVQVQKELYQFLDWPLPDGTPNFTLGPIFQRYLEDYADHFRIRSHIRPRGTGEEVSAAS
jgi:cation diffusion facilitator CzcD-associated flavoprotein CzcO